MIPAASPSADRPTTFVYRDGLGQRIIAPEPAIGGFVQVLHLSSSFSQTRTFEFALRERIGRLAKFRHAAYLPAYRVERIAAPEQGLAVVSEHVQGIRLAQLLHTAHERGVPIDITTAIDVIRQLLPPMALFHEFAPDAANGLVGPERLVVTPQGRIAIAEQVLGGAVEQLHYSSERLWRELRVPAQRGTDPARFTHRGDIMCLGLVALALLHGRPLHDEEFPGGIDHLVETARERSAVAGDRPLSQPLRGWLERALQTDGDRSFASIAEAWVVFSKILTTESAYHAAPVPLDALLYSCTAALLQPTREETAQGVEDIPEDARTRMPAPAPAPAYEAQDPQIHVEMLPPPSVAGEPKSPAPPSAEIDWSAVSEPGTAVASSQDISQLLADTDGAGTQALPALQTRPAFPVTFDELDDESGKPGGAAPGVIEPAAYVPEDHLPSRWANAFASLRKSGRLRRTALATAVVVILAAGAVWAGALRPTAEPERGTIVVQTSPHGLQVLVDGEDRGQSPARIPVSAGDHILEVRGATGARVIPMKVAGGTEVSQYLEFPPLPSAEAFGAQEPTPPAASAGPATTKAPPLTTPAPSPVAATINPAADDRAKAPTPAAPAAEVETWGWISVKSAVPLEIRSGRKVLGGASERIRIAEGRHEIELVNEALSIRATRTVYIVPGKVTYLTIDPPATGTVSINASPWAEVWIGGKRIGETPLANVSLPVGRHEVLFRHPQLGEKRQEITVTAGAPVRLAIEMK